MSVIGITKTILATELAAAIKKDMDSGFYINPTEKKPFGKNVSKWIINLEKQIEEIRTGEQHA